MAIRLFRRRSHIKFWACATSILLFLGIVPFGWFSAAPAHSQSMLELQQKGESLYAAEQYEDAAELFTAILQRNQTGQAITALEYLGAALVRKEPPDYENAAFFLERAVAADVHDGASWYDLGVARDHLGELDAATAAYQTAKDEIEICLRDILPANLESPATRNCRQALKRLNRPENVYKNLGIAQLSQGEFVAALSTFKASTDLNPEFGDGYYLQGFANTANENFEAARLAFDRSVAADVKFEYPEWSYNGRGVAHLLDGHPDRAIPDFDLALERAAAKDADALTPLANRGFANFELGKFALAERDYQTAVERAPNEPNSYYNLAYVNYAIAETAFDLSAADTVTDAIAQLPQPAISYFRDEVEQYARTHTSDREPVLVAAASGTLPLVPAPTVTESIAREAIAQLASSRLERSAQSFEQAIALQPDFADAHYGLGTVRRQQGELEQAKASFTKAKKFYAQQGDETWVGFVNELDLPALDLQITEPILPDESAPIPPATGPEIVARREGFGFTQSTIVTAIDRKQSSQLLDLATKSDDWLARREAIHALRLNRYRPAYPALQHRLSQKSGEYLEDNRSVRSAILYFLEQVSPPPPRVPRATIAIAPRRAVRPVVRSKPAIPVQPTVRAVAPVRPESRPAVAPPATVSRVSTQFTPAPSPASVSAGCGGSSIVSQAICRIDK
ncbi:MAG: tetratricopeptide repeat protein [Cyanobacteria bacterium P01_D01_bin.123]